MKRFLSKFLALTLAVVLCLAMSVPTLADEPTTGKLYYQLERYTGDTLTAGDVYLSLSSNGDLTDTQYCSSIFPPNINAKVQVVDGTLAETGWSNPALSSKGYAVKVLERGNGGFDGCTDGKLCQPVDYVWGYSCNGGGGAVDYTSFYYAYTISIVEFPLAELTPENIKITTSSSYTAATGAYTVKTSDLVITATLDGKTYTIQGFAFIDDEIDPSLATPDKEVTIELYGKEFVHEMKAQVKKGNNANNGTVVSEVIVKGDTPTEKTNPTTGAY